jgi:hypothetical protein
MSRPLSQREIGLIHRCDDLETARTAAKRQLVDQRELLALALHALRDGSPHVTQEYLERALEHAVKATDHLNAPAQTGNDR